METSPGVGVDEVCNGYVIELRVIPHCLHVFVRQGVDAFGAFVRECRF